MWCGICFCDSWKPTRLFTEQRGLRESPFLPFFPAKRTVFTLTEIKTSCDLSCQGLVEFLFALDGWMQTETNHPVSSGQKIETWVLYYSSYVSLSHIAGKGEIMREVISLLTFKVSGCFVQVRYVSTPKSLWDIWHKKYFVKHRCPCLTEEQFERTGLANLVEMPSPCIRTHGYLTRVWVRPGLFTGILRNGSLAAWYIHIVSEQQQVWVWWYVTWTLWYEFFEVEKSDHWFRKTIMNEK